ARPGRYLQFLRGAKASARERGVNAASELVQLPHCPLKCGDGFRIRGAGVAPKIAKRRGFGQSAWPHPLFVPDQADPAELAPDGIEVVIRHEHPDCASRS